MSSGLVIHQPSADPEMSVSDLGGEAGTLLAELEARQDEVLERLEALDRQVCDVLAGLGVQSTTPDPCESEAARAA